MATGTGPCRSAPADQSHQSPDELSEDDLKVVFKALHSVAEKYVFLGVEMNVKMNEIRRIQSQCSDPRGCLLEVLSVRFSQIPPLTWRDIDTALRSDTVGEPLLADRIRRQYGHLYSHDHSFEASLVQEQGRKKSEITKSKKKAKKEKSAKKYTQDFDEEVSESEKYRKPSKKVQMDVNEAVVKKTQQRAKKSPYIKRHSKPGKQYIEKESKCEGETQRKKKATKNDKESQVVYGSKPRHKMKHSEQRAQKEVQVESESESSASSSERKIVQVDKSDSTEESYSSEQEKGSAEEVSETERYQKPSEQPREDEYPHSHRETPVRKTKGKRGKFLEKSKFESQSKPEGKAKRIKKAVDQSISKASQNEMAGDADGKHEKVAREYKQKKSEKHSKKGVQKAPRENESVSSAMRREEGRVSSLYHRGKSRKPKSAKDIHLQQKQSQGKKLEYQTKPTAKKEVEKKVKGNVSVAGEQSSDEEVREKSAPKSLRQKEEQTKSESEDESSSASTSDDGSEPHPHESTRMKEHHKVHPNTDGSEIEKERDVKTKENTKVAKQKGCRSSDTEMREQSRGGERCTKVKDKTNKASKEKYIKADDTSPRKEREEKAKEKRTSSKRKVVEQDTPSSGSTQEDSEDEESDSDDSSEDEEDRDSEQKSSNEEEETEPDDESSPDTSEEEVKRKPAVPYMKGREKETGGRKRKRVKITADVSGDEDQSDPGVEGRDQEEHDIQPKKRSRRRHRESSMSPTTRGSSSPSSSQEENQKVDAKEQRRKNKKGENHKNKGKLKTKKEKGEASDSSPECDRSSESEKLRINFFERFYGQLCCEISNPVETAAQLQKKGLISKAVMRDMMRSPESQQEKTINLVDKLDEIIKFKPDCLFTFIEVLLENDALQKVGSEILTAAGK